RKTGEIKVYTEKEGLSNNIVYNIFEDKSGNLWVSTNFGLSQFNPKTETFVNFDVKDGIQSHEFNSGAAAISKDGRMYFGGMNGFNSFYPQEVKRNEKKPPIVITTFKILNVDQELEINDGDTINLTYNDNFFSFEFSALDFSNPSKNRFAFKLDNFDPDWIYVDANKRFAEYTKVSPGTYLFHVKGTNNDGVWNEKGTSVVIIISPAWWNTWAFRIVFGSFILLLIYNIIRLRFKRIKAEHEIEMKMLAIEKQVFELEQKSLRLQMNPHFIFNSLNSIQSFVISNDTDKAILYLAKFAQLMRLILTNTRESFITVKDELKALSYYMDIERLRFDNKFEFEIILDKDIDDDFVGIPPMIIQPYIENAILHGINYKEGKGKLTISIKLEEDTLLCIIEDDGVGREKAMEFKQQIGLKHKSRGMEITKERLEILNRQHKGQTSVRIIDLRDENGKAIGTKVELSIPFIDL
ncbi:MAG: histidine kinase, partial [Bacteroidetes bacterium]|nr:histidine kinase [Bacteroidota bacterium]